MASRRLVKACGTILGSRVKAERFKELADCRVEILEKEK